jgi:hypothetical protein
MASAQMPLWLSTFRSSLTGVRCCVRKLTSLYSLECAKFCVCARMRGLHRVVGDYYEWNCVCFWPHCPQLCAFVHLLCVFSLPYMMALHRNSFMHFIQSAAKAGIF